MPTCAQLATRRHRPSATPPAAPVPNPAPWRDRRPTLAATRAYAADRDLLSVQQLLGHASVATTQRYTKLPDDALRRAVLSVA